MNKLFNFYWKKENQMLIFQIKFFCYLFLFLFLFSFSFFYFFNIKDGVTPLYIAACEGYEQIVQILLKKGANVDLADKVILLIVSFFFPFFYTLKFVWYIFVFLFFFLNSFLCLEWLEPSSYCCFQRF